MRRSIRILLFIGLLLAAVAGFAASLTGTATNGTTGKPAAGDEVVLLKLGQGMEEAGRTKTDAKGKFSFDVSADEPHLIRVVHQGATYHRMAPPGSTSVEVEVYDVAKKVNELGVTADVMRLQTQGDQLQGIRLFAVNNTSNPPRTQMNDQNFEFFLPEGAVVETGMAKTAGGQTVTSAPVPQKEKNRYAFLFPLRPGETQFQVVFHMPYSGQATIDPKALYPSQHFVVMLPKSMQFTPGPGAPFQSMQDPRQGDAVVQVASNTQAGQPLSFKISGTGTLPDTQESGGQSGGGGESASGGRDSRPGGGLGPPIDAPDPLEKARWYILGGFALVLAAGGIYITRRSRQVPLPEFGPSEARVAASPDLAPITPPAAPKGNMLLEALKEELFQLEIEHKQGRISHQEYQKAKDALDQTLERALKRESAKA